MCGLCNPGGNRIVFRGCEDGNAPEGQEEQGGGDGALNALKRTVAHGSSIDKSRPDPWDIPRVIRFTAKGVTGVIPDHAREIKRKNQVTGRPRFGLGEEPLLFCRRGLLCQKRFRCILTCTRIRSSRFMQQSQYIVDRWGNSSIKSIEGFTSPHFFTICTYLPCSLQVASLKRRASVKLCVPAIAGVMPS
jgi:hypothetical protein